MNKKLLTEQEIRTRFITPAIQDAGWKPGQIREEVTLDAGRVIVRGALSMRSAERKRVDYLLSHKPGIPLAIVEAKDNNHSLSAGMDQALQYAALLDAPFVYTSNGDGFMEHDRTLTDGPLERELRLDEFPSPEALWLRTMRQTGMADEVAKVAAEDYYYDRYGRAPRYYQEVAINRTVRAIAQGQKRVLLVMATGTGKTYTAFQIIWRLWRAKKVRRVLFLADRNILVDQTMTNDFRFFGDKMTKVVKRQVDKSYEIYLALYQGISGTEEWQDIYRQFSPDFFDLIIVDECHRGSADADSAWREVLEYFASATQIGLTATPKETKDVSNMDYFGEPIYTYSLRQGIADGFLAPYKVIRIDLDRDVDGWRPRQGQLDRYGALIPDEWYTSRDFDRTLVIDERTQLVAWRVTEYLRATGRMQKTIIFCEDIEHAERMRHAIANMNGDLVHANRRYVMRITGDNPVGKAELDNFISPEEPYPVIATTSRLMTTGVDAQTCKLIVLDRTINSMTEFKQIIGRGTRIREDFGKTYFTIMDFRNVTRLFADPAFDGDPVQVYEPGPDDPIAPPETADAVEFPAADYQVGQGQETSARIVERPQRRDKYYVNGVEVRILAERVQYLDRNGELRTASFREFSRENLRRQYASLDDFLTRWNAATRKDALLAELLEQGFLLDKLREAANADLDPFDLICHVAFDRPPLTRGERARSARRSALFDEYGGMARRTLEALLDKYADQGIASVEEARDENKAAGVLQLPPLNQIGQPVQILKAFGGKKRYFEALAALAREIYRAA
ncbi:MAG: DEAD/DEAH box helicase family protein [Anaerolineae bacterium]|uniref:EcoAI/FtnUII family type I restriction enzme subunit R n=1 Tax=Candidatus Amarolinea dominans TaxID=3140696 RepID=UPI003134CA4F|nr:DEAD/DEAH box helicase family protein [Anaerolineae bacterium]